MVPGPVPGLRVMMAHHWVKVVNGSTAPDSDLPRQQDYNEEETGDSKSMRITLMEEVLLLGLRDREIR